MYSNVYQRINPATRTPTRARTWGSYCSVMAEGRHGLTVEQIYKLAEAQNFECPLSGEKLEVRDGEIYDPTTGKRIPIDHDHKTGLIRGLLVEKVNWLIDQWDHLSYGKLPMPQEIVEYKNNPPAFNAIGKIKYI